MQIDCKVNTELNSFGTEQFIISEDEYTATYIDPEGKTFKLKVGYISPICYKCFFYQTCNSRIKHYCCKQDRTDGLSINWIQRD